MPSTRIAILCSLLLATSCISNHTFAERGGNPPDWQQLEQAKAALPDDDDFDGDLVNLQWFPLIALQLQQYAETDPLLLAGNTLLDGEAYGPLAMFGDVDEWSYDEQGQLYERKDLTHAFWGLWTSKETRVRVPTGWRIDAEPSLLFGLLRWPSTAYVDDQAD